MSQQSSTRSAISPTFAQTIQVTDTLKLDLGALFISIPIVLVCGILLHRQYRTVALRRQIQKLEKLWMLNSAEKHS